MMHHLWSVKLLLLLVTLLVGTNSKFCCAASLTADEHKPSIIEKYSNTNKTTNYYEETSSDKFVPTEEVITNDHYYGNATTIQLHRPKRATGGLEAMGFVVTLGSGLLTAFDFVYNKEMASRNESSTRILNGLNELKAILARNTYTLDNLKNQNSYEHMRTRLSKYRIAITESLTYSAAFVETNSVTSKENLIKHGPMLETAINTILNGLNGFDKEFDILDTVRNVENGHARKFLEGVETYRRLLMVALGVIPIYYKITNADEKHIAFMKREWIKNDEKAVARIRKIELECRDEGAQNIEKDMKEIMETHSAETTDQVSKRIYNHLSDKYETSLWAVITYAAESVYNNHAWKGCCRKGTVFQVGGKNAVAFSFQRNEKAANYEFIELHNVSSLRSKHLSNDCGDSAWESKDFREPVRLKICCPVYSWDGTVDWTIVDQPFELLHAAAEEYKMLNTDHYGYGIILDSSHSLKTDGICYNKNDPLSSFFPKSSHFFIFSGGKSQRQRKYFWLESKLNNMTLDDSTRASTYPGGFVHMHPYHGRANQFWYFEAKSSTIRAMKTDLCLTSNGGYPNHVTLELCNPDKRNDQKWTLENNGNVVNVDKSLCLDILRGNRGTFARLIVFKCHGKPNQKWTRKFY